VSQETPAVTTAAVEYVMQGDIELWQVQQAIDAAEEDGSEGGATLIRLHETMEQIDGYTARSRAARLMHGLGFTSEQEEKPVSGFSGGWRMRLNLAQALMCRSDLLLLDEPTNHLDLEAVIWLEKWLKSYRGTLLLISHDRDFLDRCINRIAHVEQQSVTLYQGNYTAFETQRAERLALQQSGFEKQQRQIAHMNSYIERFRAKATKARQAQSRIKALERMQLITPAHVDSPFSFSFRHPGHIPNPLLRLNRVHAGYGDTTILQSVSLSILPGERIGLLGQNGAGKSTLIKLLADASTLQQGQREEAQGLRIGYFAQHQLEQLSGDSSPLQHLQRLDEKSGGTATEKELRSFLGGFAFHGDMATNPVAPFSGGEKARLVLAMLVYQQPNLLLLDEPTNHLDLEMRYALTLALQSFEGAMILVSHDRHLLRTVCDSLLLVARSGITPFSGDLDDYAKGLFNEEDLQPSKSQTPDRPPARSQAVRKEQRRLESERRKELQPLRNRVKKLEQSMEKLQSRKTELAEMLANPTLYEDSNKEQLKSLALEHHRIEAELDEAEEAWMVGSEELEAQSS
ncbi:MAG TPA: ATP-binding cassette domain-containing protein, partial [Mariprofundaceae bacterium]|nr:ATP-binding cassette domain-containing protein [Mariprofundaceae bacterium]